jgi:acyl carrier protein
MEKIDMDQIEQQLLTYIREELVSGFKGDLQPDTSLEGIIDSTAVMELVVWIEGRFKFSVEIDDINPENFGTVRRLGQWIQRNIEGKAA